MLCVVYMGRVQSTKAGPRQVLGCASSPCNAQRATSRSRCRAPAPACLTCLQPAAAGTRTTDHQQLRGAVAFELRGDVVSWYLLLGPHTHEKKQGAWRSLRTMCVTTCHYFKRNTPLLYLPCYYLVLLAVGLRVSGGCATCGVCDLQFMAHQPRRPRNIRPCGGLEIGCGDAVACTLHELASRAVHGLDMDIRHQAKPLTHAGGLLNFCDSSLDTFVCSSADINGIRTPLTSLSRFNLQNSIFQCLRIKNMAATRARL